MERGSRKRSSSAGSEKMVADKEKMEGHCSTGHSLQWAVVPMGEEEEEEEEMSTFRCKSMLLFSG